MQFLVCIAGLPHEVVDEIQQRPTARLTKSRNNAPIAQPVPQPFGLNDRMSDGYLQAIARRLTSVPVGEDASVILIHVDYKTAGTERFVRRFCPFALAGDIKPFYPDAAPKNARRSALLKYVNEIEKRADELRSRARLIRDALSGQNFTPLLLPVRNFQSTVLSAQVDALFGTLGTAPNPRMSINEASAAISASHPLQQQGIGKQRDRWFEDDRQLRFKSPGRDRHGMARTLGKGHGPECLIGGRVRFGGPFDPLFHYDCDYERRSIGSTYPNCHNADTAPKAKTHVNIAPNDYVR